MSTPVPRSTLTKDSEAQTLDQLASEQVRLRQLSRSMLGVKGDEHVESLRAGMRTFGVGWYPLMAVGLLAVADQFQLYGFQVLGPDISRSLGIGAATLGTLVAINQLMITCGALPMAAYTQRHPRRALIVVTCGFLWAFATFFTGFVVTAWGMLAVLVLNGVASGSTKTIQPALLMDTYPPPMRVRVQAFHRGAIKVGQVIAPLMVGLCTALLGFTWRGVFPAMGVAAFVAAVIGLRLRDPGFGKWEEQPVRETVREQLATDEREGRLATGTAEEPSTPAEPDVMPVERSDIDASLGFFEVMRRLMIVPTVRRILVAYAIFGVWLIPLETFIFFFLSERWRMGPGARGLFLAGTSLFGIAALIWFGRRGESLFRKDPVDLVSFTAKMGLVMVAALLLAVLSPSIVGLVLLFGVTTGAAAIVFPSLLTLLMSIVPPAFRTHAAALGALFLDGVGGLGGLAVLGGLDRRFGVPFAVASLSIPGSLATLALYSARKTINADLDRMIDDIVEDEEVRTLHAQGVALPMLACRHIDFSYDGVQVLFDVNFAVDDGEMVALLGTNGAGKSTLLRVISGLGTPHRGRAYFCGRDVTFIDCERRLRLGIMQIPSGRAVFRSLSVVDNLRVYSFSHGRNRQAVEAGIDATFEAFPQLAARRNQAAVTLSGGEQQMLALGKALILKPRLLLIDELSLGLAPRVVSSLLEMVHQINETGTAIVLVEQSVNIALSLVQHAYFMEKGEIRFDGSSSELLQRRDLLRSVFLGGVAKNLST
jgi:ABC-type branched-subunit amino acid transport system ATPase component/MFS family permease